MALLNLLLLGLSLLFWPFVIPGILLSFFCKGRHERWVVPIAALVVVCGWRIATGNWTVRIGGDSDHGWLVEGSRVVMSWAIGSILLGAGFKMSRFFAEELRSPRDATHKVV